MGKFRKRPVIVEAMRVQEPGGALIDWLNSGMEDTNYLDVSPGKWGIDPGTGGVLIGTLEGNMLALPGDWVIGGVQGEFYPCKHNIFEQTYEEVAE